MAALGAARDAVGDAVGDAARDAARDAALDAAFTHLVTAFNDLNGPSLVELHSEPSPLEFMRFVARNSPFVIRRAAAHWNATLKWTGAHLVAALDGQTINVAVTPNGNADAPTFSPHHNATLFAKPHEESQFFKDFLTYIVKQESDATFDQTAEVRYAQTQNDNLRDEYSPLFPDAQKDIPFVRIALQRPPDAINLWIGNSRSVTAIHKDNFENIYVQIRGRKHFTLFPPLCQPCMNEKMLPSATYIRHANSSLSLQLDDDAQPVPFATWDPDEPEFHTTQWSSLARPMRVTLEPGDMLYLPAMWYHKVTQSCIPDDEPFVAAINYWYDMEYSGTLYPLASFLRKLGQFPTSEEP
ncbi:hypothetical protein CDD81_3746 [Ophiocordyceps australis]|uniref:JmjC domain-containing protein n=1 Tax=Ophiocordyceps australis TaxID=1399860 RepID=A0A2C5XAL7_9HYPO|nr:hypothetical protein CDD81_3746 [Ophiocordyceps australis]